MYPSFKKRKSDENGSMAADTSASPSKLTSEDARKIISSFTHDQCLDIIQHAMCSDPSSTVLSSVRSIADRDPTQRKLFIRGLGWDTTTDSLRSLFSSYGDLEEAVVVTDKATGKSKGYGFITFRHIDGALLALKEPSKKIEGRMTITQLAAAGTAGPTAPNPPAVNVSLRKIYVASVPAELPADRLLAHFSTYGEIEEGPLGFDKLSGKSRGFALFVYKTAEAAKAAIENPIKIVDGYQITCKLAIDGKKGRPVGPGNNGTATIAGSGIQSQLAGRDGPSEGTGLPSSLSGQYGGPDASVFPSFGGFSGSGIVGAHHHLNSSSQSSIGMGTPGLSSVGSQVPSSLGGGYGSGLGGGPYGSSLQYGGPGSGVYGGLGMGSSLYRLPPSSVGKPSGGYPESGHYGLSSSANQTQQTQHHQPAGLSPGHRGPVGGGMYQGMPPYY